MKPDCKWLNDVECPYAMGYEECEECNKYEEGLPHPLDDGDRGDYLYEQWKDKRIWEGEE